MKLNVKNTFKKNKFIIYLLSIAVFCVLTFYWLTKPTLTDTNPHPTNLYSENFLKEVNIARYGRVGDEVAPKVIIDNWDKNCKNSKVTVQFQNHPYVIENTTIKPSIQQQTGSKNGLTYSIYEKTISEFFNKLSQKSVYKIKDIQFYKNNDLKLILYYQEES